MLVRDYNKYKRIDNNQHRGKKIYLNEKKK